MTTKNEHNQMQISPASIFLGTLIGIGFLTLFGVLGIAAKMSLDGAFELPSAGPLFLFGAALVTVLASAFFIAGFVASKVSHEQLRFDSIIHSLGTWALMAIFLMILASLGVTAEGIHRGLNSINPPSIVTDIRVTKATAVTTLKTGSDKDSLSPEDKKKDKIMAFAWWVYFASLVCGLGTSVAGGLLGRRRLE